VISGTLVHINMFSYSQVLFNYNTLLLFFSSELESNWKMVEVPSFKKCYSAVIIIIIIMNIVKVQVLRPVPLNLKVFLSLHLRLGLPISRRPRGWYWKASFGRRFYPFVPFGILIFFIKI
jgi:hypothetical protein